jgi:hypothetical protein
VTFRVQKGDVMLSLPQKMLFNVSKAVNDPQIGPMLLALREGDGSDGTLDDEEILSVYLCWERRKGETSDWHPYIRIIIKHQTSNIKHNFPPFFAS